MKIFDFCKNHKIFQKSEKIENFEQKIEKNENNFHLKDVVFLKIRNFVKFWNFCKKLFATFCKKIFIPSSSPGAFFIFEIFEKIEIFIFC